MANKNFIVKNGLEVSGGINATGNIYGANVPYVHPTGTGNNHIPSGGSVNQVLEFSSPGVATWGSNHEDIAIAMSIALG